MSSKPGLSVRTPEGSSPVSSRWGVDSETGCLRDVLLGPIDNFREILPTNSMNRAMLRDGKTLDVEGARAQYAELVSIFEHCDVRVWTTPADANLPLQIWARDGSFMTPWGMIIGQMAQWWRRGEYGPALDFCIENDVPVYDKVTAGCYEGGDFVIIKPGALLLGYSGERSQEQGAMQIRSWFEAEGWDVCLYEFDPYFLHADVTISMLAPGLAAVCTDVVDNRVQDWLRGHDITLVDVPFRHVPNLGINVVSLGNDRVLMPKQSDYLADRCRALGLEVHDPDVSSITMVGGGIHCMCQPLNRDSA